MIHARPHTTATPSAPGPAAEHETPARSALSHSSYHPSSSHGSAAGFGDVSEAARISAAEADSTAGASPVPSDVSVPLVAVAHGTRDPAGLAATAALLDMVRAMRPGLRVELGYVGVAAPLLADTLARLAGPVVVVPLLLGSGYHVREDIPAALATAPQVTARVADVLGPDPRLAAVLHERLTAAWDVDVSGRERGESGENDDTAWPAIPELPERCEAIVLAAAGSADPSANADAAEMAALLGELTGRTVVPSYLCASSPTPAEAVAALRADGVRDVAVSGYLMTPGHFARKAAASGAAVTSAPLGAHPALARVILDRYDAALRAECGANSAANSAAG